MGPKCSSVKTGNGVCEGPSTLAASSRFIPWQDRIGSLKGRYNDVSHDALRNLIHNKLFLPSEVVISKETSNGIDPYYCCFGAAVWWRRILGSPSRPLVRLGRVVIPALRDHQPAAEKTPRPEQSSRLAFVVHIDSYRNWFSCRACMTHAVGVVGPFK